MSKPLSVSQIQDYAKCGLSYKLARIDKVPQLTAAWFVQGSAVHKAIEAYERSHRQMSLKDAEQTFYEAWESEVTKKLEDHPEESDWIPSGKRLRSTDLRVRREQGLDQVRGYILANPQDSDIRPTSLIPGEPAVEVGFMLDFDGVEVTGYIDAIMEERSTGRLFPEDWKTGRKTPAGNYQLATYKIAIESLTGQQVEYGRYWMCRDNKPLVVDLRRFQREDVVDWYHQLARGIEQKIFLPNPSEDNCHTCLVKRHCREVTQ